MIRVIEEDRLRQWVGEDAALASAERAFRALAEGRVVQPGPLGFDLPAVRGEVHVKGAYLEGAPIFALKVASGFYANPERGLPSGSGLVLVFDARTGFPLAVLADNGYLTDLRTAAAGALAVRLLAPPELARVGVIGSGVQARFQLRAMARVCRIGSVRVWSRRVEAAAACAAQLSAELEIPGEAAPTPAAAVADADLVVTVTPSRQPLVQAAWLKPGTTVVAVGSDGPEKQELAVGVLGGADKVVTDRTAQCARLGELHHALEAGVMAEARVHAELGEVLVGERIGREGDELIVCDLTGVGAQDAAIAEMAWSLVREAEPEGGAVVGPEAPRHAPGARPAENQEGD